MSKTYRNKKHGFEIDLPVDWQPARIPPAPAKTCCNTAAVTK